MKKRASLYVLLAFVFALAAACSSSKSAEKGDETESKAMAQKSEGEEDEDKEDKDKDEDDEDKDEHPGDEHPGDEHPGDKAKKGKSFSAKDIKTAMKSHIKAETKKGEKGVFEIKDPKTGDKLELKFVKIHDPVRKMPKKGYFACTDFHVVGADKKLYDLDFWLSPKDGELSVTKTKIHKHPAKKDGKWVKEARYTFKNDKIAEVK